MKVSPVGACPLGLSIALSPAPNTLNLEHHRENVSCIMSNIHIYIPVRRGLKKPKS